ncbi:hypothetical protein C1646_770413 [Rhizophagus diaphanus]|nr:hypothetical protein C1646_770413 [Rhizophagus diaphanus] [Rhizophagus sp. MUCL 43196]
MKTVEHKVSVQDTSGSRKSIDEEFKEFHDDDQTEQMKEYRNSVSKEIFVKYLKEQKSNKHYSKDGNPTA